MSSNIVEDYERKAREAEQSPVPVFLKIGRAVVWVVYALVVVIVVVLLMAFVLRLFGASTDASFTQWVYRNAESMMRPFRGIFPVKELGEASVLDVSLLFGAIMYLLLAIGLDWLFRLLTTNLRRREAEAAQARAQADAMRFQLEAQRAAALAQQPQPSAAPTLSSAPPPSPPSSAPWGTPPPTPSG